MINIQARRLVSQAVSFNQRLFHASCLTSAKVAISKNDEPVPMSHEDLAGNIGQVKKLLNISVLNPTTIRLFSSCSTYSHVKIQDLDEEFNICSALRRPVVDPSQMVTLRKLSAETLDKIYSKLSELVDVLGIPVLYTAETIKSIFVSTVLLSICSHVRKEFPTLRLLVDREVQFMDNRLKLRGRMDYVIANGKDILVVVECKKQHVDDGLIQCILAVKRMYDNNDDKKATYGLTTNGLEWRFIKYEGDNSSQKLTILRKQTLITEYMNLPDEKCTWMKENTLILHIIYSAIVSALNNRSIK